MRSHGARKAHSWEVSVSAFVLLNDEPLGMGQDCNLGGKSRPNFFSKVNGRQMGGSRVLGVFKENHFGSFLAYELL